MTATTSKTSFWQKATCLLVVLLVGLVSRLPQLTSPHLLLDGDEAIVGLMAKHLLAGKQIPLYFYGQKYGFAYFEALIGATSFKFFGFGALQLKSGMLAIWLGALAFFYLAAAKLTTPLRGFWLALIFALFPAWAVWSLKARGGYLTSFLFASVLTYLFINQKKGFSALSWLGIGVLLGVVFYAQAFWLAGLFPLIAYHFYKHFRLPNLILMGIGIAAVAFFFFTFGNPNANFWHPTVIGHNNHFFTPWQKLPDRFYMHLTGYYYLNSFYKPDTVTRVLTFTWVAIFVFFVGVQIYRLVRYLVSFRSGKLADFVANQTIQKSAQTFLLEKFNSAPPEEKPKLLRVLGQTGFSDSSFLNQQFSATHAKLRKAAAGILYFFGQENSHLLFLSVAAIIGYSLFMNEQYYGFRYLLPLSGFMLLWLGAEFNQLWNLKLLPKFLFIILIPSFIAAGGVSLYNFRKYSLLKFTEVPVPPTGSEEDRLNHLFSYLKARNISHVFSTDQLLEWFVIFYSNEKIISRSIPPRDRYPEYPQIVDKAFKEGKPTVLFGYYPQDHRLDTLLAHPEKLQRLENWYYIYPNPTFAELVKIGFYKVPGRMADSAYVAEGFRKAKIPGATTLQ